VSAPGASSDPYDEAALTGHPAGLPARAWMALRYLLAYAVWLANAAAAALVLPAVHPLPAAHPLAVQLAVFFATGPWTVALY
jgi:hypothetical protein